MVPRALALVREGRWVGTGFGVDGSERSRSCGGGGSGSGYGCGWIWPRLISTYVPYFLAQVCETVKEVNLQFVS